MDVVRLAQEGFERGVAGNAYPGRGLVVGRGDDGAWLQVYWITGRSARSRARRLIADGGTVRSQATDALADPTYLLYEAMLERPGLYVVSNGDHTRALVEALARGDTFEGGLEPLEREGDAPHYTPRIAGLVDLRGAIHGVEPRLALAILRANDADASLTDRTVFRPALPPPGYGYGLTTYTGDGAPLPPFRGDPLWLPLDGEPEALAARYWAALGEHRVALALKRIPVSPAEPSSVWVRNRQPDA